VVATPEYKVGNQKYTRISDDRLLKEYTHWTSARESAERERQREFENLRLYAGIDNSQWPDELQNFLKNESRGTNWGQFTHLGTYNFAKQKINGIGGSLIRNPFDSHYIADESTQAELTMALNEVYMSDKDLMNWNFHRLLAYIQGLIYASVLRMYVRTDTPANPMGNIAIECMPPGSFVIDPSWKSGDTNHLNNIWTLGWFTGEEIKNKWDVSADLVDHELWLLNNYGEDYETDTIRWNRDIPEKHGDRFLVVQHNYMKLEKIEREFDPTTGIVFWEWMSDEQKVQLAQENGVDSTNIKKLKLKDRIEYVYTFAPALTTAFPIYEGKEEFQVGRLKYFPFTTEWVNGKAAPMLEQLRDAQVEINESMATMSLAAKTAVTSGVYADEAMFGMDKQKMDEFEQNRGNPRYVAWLKAGASRAFPNGIGQIVKQPIPADVFNITNLMIDLMDRLVPQPPATEGRTERSGESGVLFEYKVEVARTMQTVLFAGIRQLENNLGDAYFFLAKQLYCKGRRRFTNAQGTKETIINEPVITPEGEITIRNDFSGLARHRTNVSEKPSGTNNRLIQRELNLNLMQNFSGLPLLAMNFGRNLLESIDMDDAKKESAIEDLELERERIRTQTQAAIANAKAVVQQAEAVGQPPAAGQPPTAEVPPPAMPTEITPELTEQFTPQPAIMGR
jgi:hypothetical protein